MKKHETGRKAARLFRQLADVADTDQNARALRRFASNLEAPIDGAELPSKERLEDRSR